MHLNPFLGSLSMAPDLRWLVPVYLKVDSKMHFWRGLIYCSAGDENPCEGQADGPWCAVAEQLLKLSSVENWGSIKGRGRHRHE